MRELSLRRMYIMCYDDDYLISYAAAYGPCLISNAWHLVRILILTCDTDLKSQ